VTFTSDEDGTYYYAVVVSGAEAPTIDTTGEVARLTAGETTTITLDNLGTGAYDIYIAVKDALGNESVLKITIPAYTTGGGGDEPAAPGNEEPVDNEPEDTEPPVPEVDTGDEGAPAVIVPIAPDEDVKIETNTRVGTVTIPQGAVTSAIIEAAIEEAAKAGGTEPTVEIKVDEVPGIDQVNTVKEEIPISELQTVANSDVENVKIVTTVGEVTLNTDALRVFPRR
jgi:hypothetical protein